MKKPILLISVIALFTISAFAFGTNSTFLLSKDSGQTRENLNSDDSSEIINVIASIEIKEGHLDEFTKIFVANVPNVLAEKGCIEYIPTIDVPTNIGVQKTNKNIVTIIERWESLEHLYAHLKAPHMNTYREKVKDIVVGVSIKVLSEVKK